MKLRVYADTSVFSAYHDDRAPDRKALTREFWQNLAAYECATSQLAVEERREIQILERLRQALDHPVSVACPESNYLKCLISRVL